MRWDACEKHPRGALRVVHSDAAREYAGSPAAMLGFLSFPEKASQTLNVSSLPKEFFLSYVKLHQRHLLADNRRRRVVKRYQINVIERECRDCPPVVRRGYA
jgi:hypothetical protein